MSTQKKKNKNSSHNHKEEVIYMVNMERVQTDTLSDRSVAVLPGSEKKKHQLTCPCGHSTPVAPLLQSEESPGWLRLLLHTTACWGREVLQRLQGGEGWKHTVERRGRGLDDRKRPPPPTNKLQCWYILTQHMERCSYFEFFEFVLFFKEKIVFNEQNTLLVS